MRQARVLSALCWWKRTPSTVKAKYWRWANGPRRDGAGGSHMRSGSATELSAYAYQCAITLYPL